MEQIPLPEIIEIKETGVNQADIIIGPAYPGYGNTIGNSLRRVLLSSLPGAAVTAAKIKGITHEFTALEGVKEDVVEIILNLKKLRFKVHSEEPVVVKISAKGDQIVTGKDIQLNSDIELSNPSQRIATLTSKTSTFEMELTVKSGRGYLPVENINKDNAQLGTINIDAVFTPVKNVNYRIENVRVGQMTNYDRIILTVLTDGTITPQDALRYAAQALVDQFSKVVELASPLATPEKEVAENKNDAAEAEIDAPEEKAKKKRGRPKKEAK
ncbi:MAG: DNA-directed RNA polymerase subunit alpha [Candidatus Kerfeldbacteria bacterium]|nr:DNA-directed RNA polymerase subunit alpha [Candidatus Kerfeldbacteria bacterium]